MAHGWLSGPRQLAALGRALEEAGYDVRYVAHRSLFGRFDAAVETALKIADTAEDTPVHLIGFSLGGLVMRATAAAMTRNPASLLLIGTPNAGSTLADLVGRLLPTPAIRRLSSTASRLPEPPPGVRVACIFGDQAGIVGRLLTGDNDSRVTVASALAVRHDAAFGVSCKHRTLNRHPETLRLALAFLERQAPAANGSGATT